MLKRAQWYPQVVPATWDAEAEESLEPWSLRLAWAKSIRTYLK